MVKENFTPINVNALLRKLFNDPYPDAFKPVDVIGRRDWRFRHIMEGIADTFMADLDAKALKRLAQDPV